MARYKTVFWGSISTALACAFGVLLYLYFRGAKDVEFADDIDNFFIEIAVLWVASLLGATLSAFGLLVLHLNHNAARVKNGARARSTHYPHFTHTDVHF